MSANQQRQGTGRQSGTSSFGSGGGGWRSGYNNRKPGSGSGAGAGAGRGGGGERRGGGWGPNRNPWKSEDKRPMTERDLPKGPVIVEWDVKALDKLEGSTSGSNNTPEKGTTTKLTKEDYQLLASYNWLPNKEKEGSAAIIVPGLPARWTPPTFPAWLNQDQGTFFIDQNGFRSPHCPFEPALRALFIQHPNLDPSDIDIITDRNNLRKLFRFATGVEKFLDDFKLYVEVINKTVVLTRWETETLSVIAPGEFRGFGHAFEAAFTKYTEGLVGSSGHNRLARYKFGGLSILVRFSADAYLGSQDVPGTSKRGQEKTSQKPDQNQKEVLKNILDSTRIKGTPLSTTESKVTPNSPPTKSKVITSPKPEKAANAPSDPYDLISLFEASLNLKSEAESKKPSFEIIPGGILIPQERVLEIKTRGASRPIELADQIPQCWFSHTTNLFVGYHQRGCFNNVDKEVLNVKDLEKWEENNQGDLRKMKVLLEEIVRTVRSMEGGRAVIACLGGKLKIHGIEKDEVAIGTLPADLRRRWE